ncbi:MAG: glycosyltransferase [Bacteroidales bacterium]
MEITEILNNPVYFTLALVFAAMALIQLFYFWFIFSRLAFYKSRNIPTDDMPPVSIVITASNQYRSLRDNLPALFEQDYSDFEVVVVNDNSDDDTDELLKSLSGKYPKLKVVELTQSLNWFRGRKFPLSLGIKSSANELLMLTDADCVPAGRHWLRQMVSAYKSGTCVVLGYASWKSNSRINKWLRFTAFYDALMYLSMALAGVPFKGIGRNLSYKKSLFYAHKGFSSHYIIDAGDDELFVNRTASRKNTVIRPDPEAQVFSTRADGFSAWFKTERTRLLIRRFFRWKHRFALQLFNLSNFLFHSLFVILLVLGVSPLIILGIFLLRFISQMIIFGLSQKRLSEKKLLLLSPVFEFALILIDFLIWLMLIFTKKKKWA